VLRVTADTNIFISALNFKGKPFDLLTLARVGRIEIAMSANHGGDKASSPTQVRMAG
jgi:predicted nucleic acid-binding protein